MSALESALDVLSRAATMVQEEGPKSTEPHRRSSNARRKERQMDPIQHEALDMSKGKPVPPTFLRPSVIISSTSQSGRTKHWDTLNVPRPSTSKAMGSKRMSSIYDTAIDEHFKRSLGAERYAAVFHSTGTEKEVGLSVDDHFAKSLGDQWAALKDPVGRRSMSNHTPAPSRSMNSFPSFQCCSSCGLSHHVTSP